MDVGILDVATAKVIADQVLKACDTGETLIDVVVLSPDGRYLAKATTSRQGKGQLSRPMVVASLLTMALAAEETVTEFPLDWIARQPTTIGDAPALVGAMVVAATIVEDPAEHRHAVDEPPVLLAVGAVGVLGVPAVDALASIHEVLAHHGFSYCTTTPDEDLPEKV